MATETKEAIGAREDTINDLKNEIIKERDNRFPRLVLAVIGDSTSFVPKPWLTQIFQLGLIKTAEGAKGKI